MKCTAVQRLSGLEWMFVIRSDSNWFDFPDSRCTLLCQTPRSSLKSLLKPKTWEVFSQLQPIIHNKLYILMWFNSFNCAQYCANGLMALVKYQQTSHFLAIKSWVWLSIAAFTLYYFLGVLSHCMKGTERERGVWSTSVPGTWVVTEMEQCLCESHSQHAGVVSVVSFSVTPLFPENRITMWKHGCGIMLQAFV